MGLPQIIIMFDKQKARELEQRSHNRGVLSKEFYHSEQIEQERKRRELKQELDRQTEEHRRQREQKKLEEERRIRKEEEEISNYYRSLENREKKLSSNESNLMQNSNMRYYNQPAQTYPNENHQDSRFQPTLNKNRVNSKASLLDGDIPLMPVLPTDYNVLPTQHLHSNVLSNSKQNLHKQSIGNIPLLDLSEEPNMQGKFKKGKQKTSKRQRTLQMGKEQSLEREKERQKGQESRKHNGQMTSNVREERKSTLADEESIYGSNVKGANSLQKRQIDIEQIQEEIEQVENQNVSLKNELKKNQEALSLLIGAVRSNGKLDKYRVQAQKILSGGLQQSIAVRKEEEKKEEERLMLPKINLRHQSILHDYLITAARRSKKPK